MSSSSNASLAVGSKRQRAILAIADNGSVTSFASCGDAAAHCRPDIKVTSAKTKIYAGLKDPSKMVYGLKWKYADAEGDEDTEWHPVPLEGAGGWSVARDGRIKSPSGRIQTGCIHRDGHVSVEIAGKTRVQHTVLAAAFLPGDESTVIVHIDGDKTNNQLSNLKRVTRSELMTARMALSTAKSVAVDQYTSDGTFVATHKSMADANRSIGKNAGATGIKTCVAGKIALSSGFIWKRHEPATP